METAEPQEALTKDAGQDFNPAIALPQTRGAPFCSPLQPEQSSFKTHVTQP